MGYDELVEFLPNRRLVNLVSLYDAVNRPKNVTFKEVLDEHGSLDLRDQLEGAVVVVVFELSE